MLLVQHSDNFPRDGDGVGVGAGGTISDHLRNHLHLTNCIHLKNHMHHHSPVLADRSLRRNLIVLQRSRSLRDPSTSPPSWHSPSVAGHKGMKRLDKDGGPPIRAGRRSLGSELQMKSSWLSPRSSVMEQANRTGGGGGSLLDAEHSGSYGATASCRMSKEEEEADSRDEHEYAHFQKDSSKQRERRRSHISQSGGGTYAHNTHHHLKTLKEELQKHATTKDAGTSKNTQRHPHGRSRIGVQETAYDDDAAPQVSISHVSHNATRRVKRQKFRGKRTAQGSADTGVTGIHRDFTNASSLWAPATMHTNGYQMGGEDADDNLSRDHTHVCGIPWNWSRIHHRGKTILDIAGRSLSCGRSESRLMKDKNQIPENQKNANSELPAESDHPGSCSSAKSDSDVLPLLNETGESYNRTHRQLLDDDYMGELELFAGNDQDSDQGFETHQNDQQNGSSNPNRHQTLMQKYTPKTFDDMVGQNLVIQALSNAILRRKVGLVYIFYGPQGTGKTTCARLFAKALNCQSQQPSRPCGACAPCLSQTTRKSRDVMEMGPASAFDFENIMEQLNNLALLSSSSTYMVFIVDECDSLPSNSWSSISKVIDHAPRRVVFLLVCTTIDHLPHSITSKCQKFYFPKLKDVDIISKLQQIAVQEGLEIENDTLKLIASRSDGSLRDAEMTLDQLSLLGQRISLALVQELVGMVSDEKLIDLLDFALSGDTMNTVKRLRDITEAGVEPLALMSQLATVITDILAGRYVFSRERQQRKFFRSSKLSKDNMEKLRLALKTLSDAEKQLRLSNEKLTWLTAAVLQFAPNQLHLLPSSSGGSSLSHSPMLLNYSSGKDRYKNGGEHNKLTEARHTTAGSEETKVHMDVRKIWKSVIERIQLNALKQLMQEEGKLISVNIGAAPTVQLQFSSHVYKTKAEKFRGHILHAFESVLGTTVTLEIRSGSWIESNKTVHDVPASSISGDGVRVAVKEVGNGDKFSKAKQVASGSYDKDEDRIVEIPTSPLLNVRSPQILRGRVVIAKELNSGGEASCSRSQANLSSVPERRGNGGQSTSQSLVKGKVSLARVIQQTDGSRHGDGWSRRKAISIAEKLEQENIRLEPSSKLSLCWKVSKITSKKLLRMRIRTKRPTSLLKLLSCGKCVHTKTPR